MSSRRSLVLLVCLALMGLFAPATTAQAAVPQKGTYHPLTASRLLDTRTGVGATKQPLGAAKTLQLTVAGRGGVPSSGVSAVVLNLTVTGPTASSYLAVYPSGSTRPTVSAINFLKGWTRANSATVPLGTGGKVTIYNSAGSTAVIADVLGYYASDDSTSGGSEFTPPAAPDRLLDTRQTDEGALAAHTVIDSWVDFGTNGELNASVKALALNITVIHAGASGFVTAWDGKGDVPVSSTLNFQDAGAVANLTVVKTTLCTECSAPAPVQFSVYNGSSASVDVIVDLVGIYYNDGTVGLRFSPLTPQRITDSRKALNGKPLAAQETQLLTAPTAVANTATDMLVANVTAVSPTSNTYLTLWKSGDAKPTVSNLNARPGANIANGALFEISGTRKFNIYNSTGTTNFLIDVTGRFVAGPTTTAAVAAAANRYSGVAVTPATSTQQRRSTSR